MEKKNGQKICIYGLRSKGGTLLLNHIEIRKRAVEFYEELYSSELTRRSDSDNVFIEGLPQVSDDANGELCREC